MKFKMINFSIIVFIVLVFGFIFATAPDYKATAGEPLKYQKSLLGNMLDIHTKLSAQEKNILMELPRTPGVIISGDEAKLSDSWLYVTGDFCILFQNGEAVGTVIYNIGGRDVYESE